MADNNLAKVFATEDFNPEKCELLQTRILLNYKYSQLLNKLLIVRRHYLIVLYFQS